MIKCKIIYKRDPETLKITDKIQAVKAPNGNRSLLFDAIRSNIKDDKKALTQYFKVYTDEFKEEFGDWENNKSQNITEVIDTIQNINFIDTTNRLKSDDIMISGAEAFSLRQGEKPYSTKGWYRNTELLNLIEEVSWAYGDVATANPSNPNLQDWRKELEVAVSKMKKLLPDSPSKDEILFSTSRQLKEYLENRLLSYFDENDVSNLLDLLLTDGKWIKDSDDANVMLFDEMTKQYNVFNNLGGKLDQNGEPKYEEVEYLFTADEEVDDIISEDDITIDDTPPKQYSLQPKQYKGQPSTKSEKGSVTIDIEPFKERVGEDFSQAQLDILEAYNRETSTLTGEFVMVKVEDLPKDLQKMFELKGITETPVYETIDPVTGKKGWTAYRVSNLQDLEKVKNQSKTVAKTQEESPKSTVSKERGTQMHDINEKLLDAFVASNNPVFDLSTGGPNALSDLDVVLWSEKAINVFKGTDAYKNAVKLGREVFLSKQEMDQFNNLIDMNTVEGMVDKLVKSMLGVYHQAYMTQHRINTADLDNVTNFKPVFILEKPFTDKGADQTGTMDVFVIFSDSTASIFDHKFTDLHAEEKYIKNPSTEQLKEIERIREIQGLPPTNGHPGNYFYYVLDKVDLYKKEESWNKQIGRYTQMAKQLYKVKGIRDARILPVATTYTTVDLGKRDANKQVVKQVGPGSKVKMILTGDILGLNNTESQRHLGISQIALNVEKTGDANLDRFIGMLIKNKESLKREMAEKQSWGDPRYVDRIKKLDESIQALLVSRDLSHISDSIQALAQQIENDLNNEKDHITFEQIIHHLKDVEMFNSFISLSSDEIDKLEKEHESTKEGEENPYTEFKTRLSASNYDLTRQTTKMHSKMTSMIAEMNTEGGYMNEALFETYKKQKDMSTLGVYFTHLRESNHPIVSMFSQLLDGIETNVIKERRTLEEKINKVQKDLAVWGQGQGKTGIKVYEDIIAENGNLIRMYTNFKSEVFPDHMDQSKSKRKANIEWFKKNFERTGPKEKIFQEKYARIQEYYKRKFPDDKKEYDKEIEKWLNENDIKHKDGDNKAWFNTWVQHLLTPKNPDEYYTDAYKKLLIPGNKPLLDFYKMYTEQMNKLASKADFRIYENAIADIRKDALDTLVQDGMFLGGKQQIDNVLNWWDKNDNDDGMQSVLTESGLERKVPVFFQNNIGKKNKLMDLSKSLMIFSDFVNRYNGIKNIEYASLAMRELVSKTAGVQLATTGSVIRDDSGEIKLKEGAEATNDKLLEAFDTWIGYYIYGEKKKGDPKLNKAIDAVTAISSRKAVALNHISAIGGHINAEAQLRMIAKKTTYFTTDTLSKARKEVKLSLHSLKNAKNAGEVIDSKMVFASMFFEIAQDDMSYEKANGVSLSKMRNNPLFGTKDYAYMLQRWSDDIIDNTALTAMLMDYGIDPLTNKVYPLSRLNKTYNSNDNTYKDNIKFKDIEFKSLWDMLIMKDTEDIKLKDSPIFVNQFTNEQISDKTFTDFRRKAKQLITRAKGNMSADDIAGYKTHMVGRLVMQFRSWIPATVRERFKGAQYNLTMEQMEVGRLVAVKNMVGKNLLRLTKEFAKEVIPFIKGNFESEYTTTDIATDQSPLEIKYKQFIADNPHLAPDAKNPTLEQVTFEQFVDSHIAETRALAKELQLYIALAIGLGAISLAAGDDELKENPLLRYPAVLLDRAMLEVGFFIPVAGLSEQVQLFTKAPAASISLVTAMGKTVENTFTEAFDLFNGADFWDETVTPKLGSKPWTLDYSPRKDNSMIGYYSHQWIPPLKFMESIIGFTNTTKRSDTWYDYWSENWDVVGRAR